MANECPYYKGEYKRCNISDTHQDNDYNRNNYCLSSDNWKRCANYTGASRDTKIAKKLRPNPDL